MINFKSIEVTNFMSFGQQPTVFDLSTKGSTLIIGNNTDVGDENSSKNGVGKCHGKDTPIMMYDGTIKMVQDVCVGDLLMGDDGTPRTVLSLASGREELFKVTQNLGMEYIVNKSHILSLKVGTDRPKYGLVKGAIVNITVPEYLSYPSAVKKSVCGYIADLKKLDNGIEVFEPWLVGLWLADGSTDSPAITFNKADVELIDEVQKIATKYKWETNTPPSSDRKNCIGIYYSNGFSKKLREIGVFGNKHIPKEYLRASYDQRLELLAGILDGDGHNNRGRTIDVVLKSNQLPHDLAFLARSVGLRVKISDKFSKCQNFGGDIYKRLTISGDITKIPHRLKRKQGNGIPLTAKPRHYGVTGIKVESIGEGDYYGFELDGNHLYCLGDMTVTHNTSEFQAIIFALYGKGIDKLKTDEFINIKNGKKLCVTLVFEKAGKEYTIIRKRKPNAVEIYVDGETLTLDTMKNTDEVIQNIIGMDYDVFMTTYFLSPHREAFMAMTSANQRSMIESMLSLDVLVKRAEALKLIRKDLEVDLKVYNRDIENVNDNNQKTNDLIERLKSKSEAFNLEKEKQIKQLSEVIELLESIDFDGLREELSKKESDLKVVDDLKYSIEQLKSKKIDLSKAETYLKKDLAEIEKNLERLESIEKLNNTFDESIQKEIKKISNELKEYGDKEFIEEKIGVLNVLHEVKINLADLSKEIAQYESIIENYTNTIANLDDEIESLESGVCSKCGQKHTDKPKIVKLNEEKEVALVKSHKADKIMKKLISEYEEALTEMNEVMAEYDIVPTDDFLKESTYLSRDLLKIESLEKELKKAKEQSKENPYTSQLEAHHKDFGTKDDMLIMIDEKMAEIDYNAQEQYQVEGLLDETTKTLTKLKSEMVYPLLDELEIEHETQVKQLESDLKGAKLQLDIEQSKESPFDDEIESLIENLVDVTKMQQLIFTIETDIKHIGYLIKLLTDNKSFVRKNIVDSYIPFVNKKIIEYTDRLGLLHVCSINNDLSTDIEYMGKCVSYFNLSQGERLRLNLSVNLAFRDMITMLGKGSNLLMIDEYMDSAFDHSGLWRSFNLIKEKANTVMLISHREEFKEFVDRTLTITKRNGFSFVE